jgi:hypothetical protein
MIYLAAQAICWLGLASEDVGDVVQLREILHLRYLVTPRMVTVVPYLPLPYITLRTPDF